MKNFWRVKKVLVTGGNGFVGKHLVSRLLDLGAQTFILEKEEQKSQNSQSPIILPGNLQVVVGDIRDSNFINDLFRNNNFDVCFHLAAQSLVDKGDQNPLPTFEINIMGTANVLEAARQYKLCKLIIASTSHVYGENKLPLLEKYFPRPSRPYETSKACADILAQTYAKYYRSPIAIGRFVNIYGPGDQNQRIVPRTIQLILNNKNPEIFNDKVTRDYLYIDDAVDGYLTLAEKMKELTRQNQNIIYNFGTGKHYSTKYLVLKIIFLLGKSYITPTVVNSPRKQEIINQYVSVEKTKKILGWSPRYSLTEGLKRTIDWYASHE